MVENYPAEELSVALGGTKSGKTLLSTLSGALKTHPELVTSIGAQLLAVVREIKPSAGLGKNVPAAAAPVAVDTSSAKSLVPSIMALTPRGKFDLAFFAESVTLIGKTSLVRPPEE